MATVFIRNDDRYGFFSICRYDKLRIEFIATIGIKVQKVRNSPQNYDTDSPSRLHLLGRAKKHGSSTRIHNCQIPYLATRELEQIHYKKETPKAL